MTEHDKNKKKQGHSEKIITQSPKGKLIPVRTQKSIKQSGGKIDTEIFFDLFGNDIRRKILQKLAKFPRYASDLAIDLGVSKQAIKKHLDKLEQYGVIEQVEYKEGSTKKQYYQISSDLALFLNISLTPNYFEVDAINKPEEFIKGLKDSGHNPEKAVIIMHPFMTEEHSEKKNKRRERKTTPSIISPGMDIQTLEYSLKALGKRLHDVEKQIKDLEERRRKMIMEKAILINQIQMLINAYVEDDLEKEVIFSLFFDVKKSVEGLTLEDILNELFLRKKRRAGVSKYQYYKPDDKTLERGKSLFTLLKLLVKNFDFIRTDGMTLFFDFD